MTHLNIEQDTGTRETVASGVIKKLYDLAKEIELDANGTIALKGWLYTSATYLDYITYLENISKINGEPLLIIDAGKAYIRFADPEVLSYWANSSYGDGTGLDSTAAASVLNIPNRAFFNNTNIETFNELATYFPNCTTISHADAFSGCTNLTSIDLSNIVDIEAAAFRNCTNLTSITAFNPLLTDIKNQAFHTCTSLVIEDLNLPNLTYLGDYAFVKTKIKKISNLGDITSILQLAFQECTLLTSVILPNTVTTLKGLCFHGCSSLLCIDISGITTFDGIGQFSGCTNLVDLSTSYPTLINTGAATYTFNLATVPTQIFLNCKLTNKSFSFPNATSIGASAFEGTKIVAISIPNVTDLGSYSAFKNCTNLSNININNVTTIPDSTFNGCTSLVTVNSSNAIIIKNSAFYNCTSLQNIDLDNVILVGQNSFLYCTSLTTLNLPKFVETNGGWSFCNNTHLQTVTFGDTITSLGSYSFAGDTSLTTVTFGANSSFSLGGLCFDGCTNLTTLTNITNCTKLANLVFRNCSNLGNNETLELNLTDQDSNPEEFLSNTKYKGLILHWPNSIPNGWRSNYPLWSYMALLEYLDISDTKWGVDHRGNNSRALAFYGNTNIKTVILSPDYNYIWSGKSVFWSRPGFQHLIILNDSVIGIEFSGNDFFGSALSPQLIIYVLDSLVSSYLADATWSQIPNISSHLKGLSELSAGVWTTGLASQYLTPALLATS